MSTIDKKLADKLVAGNGWVNGDRDNRTGDNPRVLRIVEYTNAWGGQSFGATFDGQNPKTYLVPTAYIRNPSIYWEAQS